MTMPPLPTGHTIGSGIFNGQKLFTDDQMRAYGEACAAANEPQGEPVAAVTECEACFTPDVCQLRGKCDHYAASQLRVTKQAHPPQQRTPLTDDHILWLFDQARARDQGAPLSAEQVAIRLVRAALLEYGIKETP